MSFGAWIKAKMSLDSSGVKTGVSQAGRQVDGLKSQLSGLGKQLATTFSIGAIVGFSKQVVDYGSKISDLAAQTGLSTDELQGFQGAISDAGGSIEGAGKALLSLRDAQQSALDGNKASILAFSKLGISVDQLAALSMPQLLEAISKSYTKTMDFSILVDMFGKKSAGPMEEALISLSKNGFDAFTKSAAEAGELMSQSDILKLADLGDQLDRLGIRVKTFWGANVMLPIMNFGQHIANGFAALFIGMETVAGRVGKNIKNIFSGNFKDVVWTPFGLMKEAAGAAWQGLTDMNQGQFNEKADREKARTDAAAKIKKAEAGGKAAKLEALRDAEVDKLLAETFDPVDRADTKAQIEQAAEKAANERRAAEKKAQEDIPNYTAPTDTGTPGGPSISEVAGNTRQFNQRFDSLRQVGANILGSGKAGGAVDRQGELVTLARQTAENTARLVQQQNAPPVSRMAPPAAVY